LVLRYWERPPSPFKDAPRAYQPRDVGCTEVAGGIGCAAVPLVIFLVGMLLFDPGQFLVFLALFLLAAWFLMFWWGGLFFLLLRGIGIVVGALFTVGSREEDDGQGEE
jgi:hypothetical protein